jgi:hypothetical protein
MLRVSRPHRRRAVISLAPARAPRRPSPAPQRQDRLPSLRVGSVLVQLRGMPSGVSVRLTDPVAALARGVAQAAVRSAISAAGVKRALDQAQDTTTLSALRETASARVASLTKRQRQILELVLAGYLSP